jgi:hypothetical protein
MGLTNFPNGISSFGVPVLGGMSPSIYGRYWFVDAKTGADGNSGRSRDRPFLTMAKAFANIDSGDVIFTRGKIREQLATPAGVHDVTIIGAGNRPRHADDHTESGGARGSSAATWTAPASGSTAIPLLQIIQQGWRVHGITWQLSGSATACVQLHKTDDAGDSERDGAHAELTYNKFQGTVGAAAGIGVQTNGVGFFKLQDNLLLGFTTAIAKTGSAGGQVGWGEIVGNRFSDNTNGIVSPLYRFLVKGNYFLATHTKEVDLTGGTANIVTENVFVGNYDACVSGTGDFWFNNYSLDTTSGEVDDTTGQTTAVPAA